MQPLSTKIPQTLREGRTESFLMGVMFSIVLPDVPGHFRRSRFAGSIQGGHIFAAPDRIGCHGVFIAIIQKSAGVFLVVIGLLDTVTYWTY